jgi:hypothetical protein
MNDSWLIVAVRIAGVFHIVTLVLACFTPIPPDWEKNLAGLPEVHRRFAVAQNFFIGATIAFAGAVCLFFAPELISGSVGGRILCVAIGLWWGGRLVVLPWLGVTRHLATPILKAGFALLLLECATFAVAFGWLAMR